MANDTDKKRDIDKLCGDIRRLVGSAFFLQNAKRHKFNLDLTWAAMDMIEDTELAIESFRNDESGKDVGLEYLKVYGLFQAIFMQQDAARNLAVGLSLPELNITTDMEAAEVREIRNKYFGHHKYQRKGKITYHGISRMTVGEQSIKAWTYPDFSTQVVHLKDAIEANRKYIIKSLRIVLANLHKKKIEFIRQIKDKLSEDRRPYFFEKISSWVFGSSSTPYEMAGTGLKVIRSDIEGLKSGLRVRYESLANVGDVDRDVKKCKYFLDLLDKHFEINPYGLKGDFGAEGYVETLKKAFNEIIDIAIETNSDFGMTKSGR
jgi:hypothetical protein